MTLAITAEPAPLLDSSIHAVRAVLPMAGCAMPAGVLEDKAAAAWTRTHGIAVSVSGSDELDLTLRRRIRPVHVVYRCGPVTETTRRAVGLGVVRFIASTPLQVAMLAGCAHRTKYVYLDEAAPAVIGERRLEVVGLHGDVDDASGAVEWGVVAERMLCRMAHLRTCGLRLSRISLAGGSADTWLNGSTAELTSIASAIDDALDEGCARWRLPRPAVALAPLMTGTG